MAFNPQEQNIIQWGLQNGKTKEDVTKAIGNYRAGITVPKPEASQQSIGGGNTQLPTQTPTPAYGQNKELVTSGKDVLSGVMDNVSTDMAQRAIKVGDIISRDHSPKSKIGDPLVMSGKSLEKPLQIFGQGLGMGANALEKTAEAIPGVKSVVDKTNEGINWLATSEASPIKHLGDLIGNSKTLQEATKLYDTDSNFRDNVDAVANFVRLGGDVETIVDGVNFAKNVTQKVIDAVHASPSQEIQAFHGTSPENADAIRQGGFDVSKSRGGVTEPQAINLTTDQAEALNYAKGDPKGVIPVTLKGKDILTFKNTEEYINAIEKETGPYTGPNATKFLSSHDGIVVKGAGANGSDLLLSTKPKLVSVFEPTKAAIPAEGAAASRLLTKGASGTAKGIVSDVIPTVDRMVNSEITKAFDLTQGDVKNIKLSTGNDVGEFVARNNLIGENEAETIKNIDSFYKKNYDEVRSEINNVKATHSQSDVPRYKEALTALKKQIEGTAGLQSENYEVTQLLAKEKVTAADVQRVKELLDDHFSLYKATGDVKEGVAKQGLASIRKDIKEWLENEVKDNTGTDIKELNNNVQTARSIKDAIEERSTRGLTRATITPSDILTFLTGSGFATPVGGAVAVILKKIYQSPTFKLKFAKWLDGMSDANKLSVVRDFKAGKIPANLPSSIK